MSPSPVPGIQRSSYIARVRPKLVPALAVVHLLVLRWNLRTRLWRAHFGSMATRLLSVIAEPNKESRGDALKNLLLVLLLLLLPVSGVPAGTLDDLIDDHVSGIIQELREGIPGDPPRAEAIFALGPVALPLLAQNLTDIQPFRFACSSVALSTHYTFEPLDWVAPYKAPKRSATVGEISLYLIMAILQKDLFSTESCYLAREGVGPADDVEPALLEIQESLTSALDGASGSLEDLARDIQEILDSHGLHFPGASK